jgi:hypothetical protein
MLLSPQSQQTNPLRNYGGDEQALFGSTPGGGKTIFGWFINFRQLIIKLLDNKFKAWTISIKKMIDKQSTTAKDLKKNIGQPIHLRLAIPALHHFMSRLRDLQFCAMKRRSIKINREHLKDLELMLQFLKIANGSISLKSIAFRRPTHIYRSDLCLLGLGGYSNKGWAGDGIYPKT